MKNASFSYPLDMWVNEGGAPAREGGSVSSPVRLPRSAGTSRWKCRFSPDTFRRPFSRSSRKFRGTMAGCKTNNPFEGERPGSVIANV